MSLLPDPDRSTENRAIWASFRRHSRTFSLAARLLPRRLRMPVATLYLFCRTVDNLADEEVRRIGAPAALAELARLRDALAATLAGHPPADLLWRRLGETHRQIGLPARPLFELIEGATWDLEGRGVATTADLLAYSNLVGGSVGAMLLPFLAPEARADRLEASARALGTAMQITNIVRDVGEDLRSLGRVYLPSDALAAHGLTTDDLARPGLPAAYPALLEELMEAAEALYDQGLAGIAALPAGVRPGIQAAARLYREILNEVRERRYDNLRQRAYVGPTRKLRLLLHDDYGARKDRMVLRRPRPVPRERVAGARRRDAPGRLRDPIPTLPCPSSPPSSPG